MCQALSRVASAQKIANRLLMFLSDFSQGHTTGKRLSQNSDPSICERKTKRNRNTCTHTQFPQAAAAIGTTKQKLVLSSTLPFIPNHTFCGE